MARPNRNRSLDAVAARVSRSFYLSLRLLPPGPRAPISTAYLLARAADTIADTDAVPPAGRAPLLERFLGLLDAPGEDARAEALREIARARGPTTIPEEAELLARLPEVLAAFDALPRGDRRRTRAVLAVIVSGMRLDLERFGDVRPGDPPRALATRAELDDYCYRVAGVVGEYWTATQRAHGLRARGPDRGRLEGLGVRFGKALQLTNVLRDAPADLRRGRCYLPGDELAALGLAPADLLASEGARRARPLFDALLDVAVGHVRAGIAYTEAMPPGAVRARVVCALPLAIAARTLALLRAAPDPLDPAAPRKIARREVYRLVAGAAVRAPILSRLGAWLGAEAARVKA